MSSVAGRCPSCDRESLFLGDGGHVTCGWIGRPSCPDPGLSSDILDGYGFEGFAYRLVMAERRRQRKKWGDQQHTDEWWLAILTEEVGEAAEAIIADHFGGTAGDTHSEIQQVAAVAVQWLADRHRRAAAKEDNAPSAPEVKGQ